MIQFIFFDKMFQITETMVQCVVGGVNVESKNIIIAVLCLINIIIITSKFFASRRVNNDETKLYGYLLIAMLFESISGIKLDNLPFLFFLLLSIKDFDINKFFSGLSNANSFK